MAKFLSETGLQTVWSKIDSLFVRKASVSSSNNTASFGSAVTVGSVGGVDLKFTMPANPVSSNTVTSSDALTADKIVLGNGSKTVKTSGKGITTTAPSSSSDDTTIPTSKAVWSAFGSVASALKYKGTIGSSGATITALPATHAVGDMYAVKTAGTYAGKACEVGDYIICHTAGTTANNAHWDVLNGENQVENKSASLAAAGSSATIATVDGTDITVTTPSTWTGIAKTGTVTSVGMTLPTGLSVSGSPITSSGTLAVSFTSGYSIPTTTKQGNWDTAYGWGNHASAGYVKLNPGAAEQTIESSIGSAVNGVVEFYRSSGDHICFIGFSNKQGTTKTSLGAIGFRNSSYTGPYYKNGSNYYALLHEGNYTSYVNTTNFPGLNKTGTVTSVTPGTGLRNGTATTAITTSGTLNLITAATGEIGGIKASNVLTSAVTLTSGNGSTASRYYGVQVDNAGKAFVNIPWTDTNTKVTQTITASSNTSFRPLLLGYSYSDATVFAPSTTTDTTYATHLAKFKPSTGDLYVVGLRKLGTDGKVVTGSDTTVWNTNGGTTSNVLTGSNYNSSTYADTTPTQNSTKLITSGGIYSALDEIESVVAASEDALNTRVTTLENNTVTGSGLTANTIVLGNGTRTVKTSSKTISTSAPSSSSDDTTIPTSKAVNSAIASHAGVDKVGTVTSVTLTSGTGITVSSSGTAITTSGSRTISLASGVVTAGTYSSVTVDTYGRVTAGSNPTVSTTDTDIRLADFFGESTNSASTVAKTTSVTSKSLTSGDLVTGLCAIIYHQYANSGASATLNVGGSGAKAMYNAAGTRISGSTGTWTAKDIIRWVYDASLNSGSGGWKISAILGNGDSHRLRLLTGRTPLYSYTETDPTVPSWAKASTKPTYTASEVGAAADSHTHTTTIATSTGTSALSLGYGSKYSLTAGGTSYIFTTPSLGTTSTTAAAGNHTHTFASLTSKPTTVSGYGITDAVTGLKISTIAGNVNTSTRVFPTDNLKNESGTEILYSPSSGTATINAIPMMRRDAEWGDWVYHWEKTDGKGETGIIYKTGSGGGDIGEQCVVGITHFQNLMTFAASGSYTAGTVNTGKMAAAFYGMASSNPGTKSCDFYIQCKAYDSTDSWKNFVNFQFNDAGIYKYFPSDCPNSNLVNTGYWILDESMALSTSEIDTILANAT